MHVQLNRNRVRAHTDRKLRISFGCQFKCTDFGAGDVSLVIDHVTKAEGVTFVP